MHDVHDLGDADEDHNENQVELPRVGVILRCQNCTFFTRKTIDNDMHCCRIHKKYWMSPWLLMLNHFSDQCTWSIRFVFDAFDVDEVEFFFFFW